MDGPDELRILLFHSAVLVAQLEKIFANAGKPMRSLD